MDPNATKEARMEALGRAKTHNLDIATITRETVRLILEEAFAVSQYAIDPDLSMRSPADNFFIQTIPALSSEQPDISSFATSLSERDVYLIRAIEWLTFVPETAEDALIKSNDVLRYFLGQSGAISPLSHS
jgi:nuclear pore complex protein Nup107